ncbi:hypothetical protein [Terasakiella sp. SH-1]|uniref:hypothetical protein n=1 Tax=Terasakiella sp. SH-1 TaxID=2560057 RepID=UPI0010741397|nr:hypothetical protein [Terasakiella sp. SH-1]
MTPVSKEAAIGKVLQLAKKNITSLSDQAWVLSISVVFFVIAFLGEFILPFKFFLEQAKDAHGQYTLVDLLEVIVKTFTLYSPAFLTKISIDLIIESFKSKPTNQSVFRAKQPVRLITGVVLLVFSIHVSIAIGHAIVTPTVYSMVEEHVEKLEDGPIADQSVEISNIPAFSIWGMQYSFPRTAGEFLNPDTLTSQAMWLAYLPLTCAFVMTFVYYRISKALRRRREYQDWLIAKQKIEKLGALRIKLAEKKATLQKLQENRLARLQAHCAKVLSGYDEALNAMLALDSQRAAFLDPNYQESIKDGQSLHCQVPFINLDEGLRERLLEAKKSVETIELPSSLSLQSAL